MSVILAPGLSPESSQSSGSARPADRDGWALWMHWCDLLFASWRVPVEALRKLVPNELEIDTFDGSAWVTLVPLLVDEMHWKDLPPLPGMDRLRELNFRTYTTRDGKPGVYFLSIDCPATILTGLAVTSSVSPSIMPNSPTTTTCSRIKSAWNVPRITSDSRPCTASSRRSERHPCRSRAR